MFSKYTAYDDDEDDDGVDDDGVKGRSLSNDSDDNFWLYGWIGCKLYWRVIMGKFKVKMFWHVFFMHKKVSIRFFVVVL